MIAAFEDSENYRNILQSLRNERKTSLTRELKLKDGRIVMRDYMPIYEQGQYHGELLLFRDVTREKRIDAAKSEFMSLASHQLRTPLTSIRWVLSRLNRTLAGKTNDFEKKLLTEGHDGVNRMSQTIDTMLQISRIESGELQLNMTKIPICNFVAEILSDQIQRTYLPIKSTLLCRNVHPM